MGINSSFAHLLVQARTRGVKFNDTLTIGRQSLTIPRRELEKMSIKLGLDGQIDIIIDQFADSFIKHILGACSLSSVDYSDYQDADLVHDLNKPIPDDWKNNFDTVIDGGTLEHIFDVKQVLSNYMNLIRPGGNIFILTTANNLCGHGFYQFSPEFFYRVFDKANGFETREVVLIESPLLSVEKSRHIRYYHANDPAMIGKRIQLVNHKPTMIFIRAEKIADKAPFTTPPLQSDYSNKKWDQVAEASIGKSGQTPDNKEYKYLSPWEEARRRIQQRRKNSRRNKRFFTDIEL